MPATLASLAPGEPAVVVPLLLSAGYHVHVDLAEAVHAAASARPVTLAGALGPDDHVVLAVAGSSDRRAVDDCHDMAGRLAAASGREVSIGFLSTADPRLPDAIAAVRNGTGQGARIVVASYLLAPGYFDDLVRSAGADLIAQPLLVADEPAPDELVEIVLDRYDAASARLG